MARKNDVHFVLIGVDVRLVLLAGKEAVQAGVEVIA